LIIWEGLAVETEATVSYKGFRFPAEIISHAVRLYHRFPLSFREVEELLLAPGIIVSHETIRAWCDRFGPALAEYLIHAGGSVFPGRWPGSLGSALSRGWR
jgi:transposase-like protein